MNKLNEHKFCLNNEEALQFIELLKSYDKDLYWNKGRNIHWRTINFVPNDRDELAGPVPGATVQVDYKYSKRVKESGKLVLTLFKRKQHEKLRAYQLELSDENKISSHDGNTIIKGSHEHIGKQVRKIIPGTEIENIAHWFALFCDKIRLEFTGSKLNLPEE
ncbi:hypothetical protein [Avibacterium paragallinarum]|uniref:Uncharacterized protein n=1 Tax=Avibacterium paragallinarum TaxID=728 RepID=A0A8B3T5W7_AVIPA|nr:hypothetical protein [Avibacterium paragallinarum]RZN55760.1 hypothetical protein EIG79_11010 [Avibacterium paragallinarum]